MSDNNIDIKMPFYRDDEVMIMMRMIIHSLKQFIEEKKYVYILG